MLALIVVCTGCAAQAAESPGTPAAVVDVLPDLRLDGTGQFDSETVAALKDSIASNPQVIAALGPRFTVIRTEPIGHPGAVSGVAALVHTAAPVLLPAGSPTYGGTETETVERVTTESVGPLSYWWVHVRSDSSVRAFLPVPG